MNWACMKRAIRVIRGKSVLFPMLSALPMGVMRGRFQELAMCASTSTALLHAVTVVDGQDKIIFIVRPPAHNHGKELSNNSYRVTDTLTLCFAMDRALKAKTDNLRVVDFLVQTNNQSFF